MHDTSSTLSPLDWNFDSNILFCKWKSVSESVQWKIHDLCNSQQVRIDLQREDNDNFYLENTIAEWKK